MNNINGFGLLRSNRIFYVFIFITVLILFGSRTNDNAYLNLYRSSISNFKEEQIELLSRLGTLKLNYNNDKQVLLNKIYQLRISLKKIDLWLRYFEPVQYKKINGPLEVEWENEVFEKFERPYQRLGAGLSLIENCLNNDSVDIRNIENLLISSIVATKSFLSDSLLKEVLSPDNFVLANRLFLLNLSAIYTTGFECPNKDRVLIELKELLNNSREIYLVFNKTYPDYKLTNEYLVLFDEMRNYLVRNMEEYNRFNHFLFIKDYVNPLFGLNQSFIRNYKASSISYNEFTLNNEVKSIFDKSLFSGQDMLGVYRSVKDKVVLREIENLGELLFNDPLFSGNIKRSCTSCHKSSNYFTDTAVITSLQFNNKNRLERNTPSLINVEFNHMLMLDGSHFNIFNQIKDVSSNSIELNSSEQDILKKILSCKDYNSKLRAFAKLSTEKKITFRHLSSAISFYLSSHSRFSSKFDKIMNKVEPVNKNIEEGFNLFMGKSQCATCHFVPYFNGVKPPFINSEFEVIGVPVDTSFAKISPDKGRWKVIEAKETLSSFRTPTLRNVTHTKPYMHNGVFTNLDEVLDFYNKGGGVGHGLNISNQTLSNKQLNLSKQETKMLTSFMESLSEDLTIDYSEFILPKSKISKFNSRQKGGEY